MTAGRRVDLHVHSRYSPDGTASVDELVARAVEIRLDGLALTDHNSVAGHPRLAELQGRYPQLLLVPGVEVSTSDGHLLAFGIRQPPDPGLPVAETVARVLAAGGVAVPAHPFRRVHGIGGRLAGAVPVPALEALNAHNRPAANDRARRLARVRGRGSTGGSDAHQVAEVGGAWTEFPEEVASVPTLLEALRAGRTSAGGRELGADQRLALALRSLRLRLARGLRPL